MKSLPRVRRTQSQRNIFSIVWWGSAMHAGLMANTACNALTANGCCVSVPTPSWTNSFFSYSNGISWKNSRISSGLESRLTYTVQCHRSSGPQDGMRDVAAGPAIELAKRLPVPKGATRLLDIGGSHGLYSIELCKRYGSLRSTILELPGAIDRASAIAARHGMADRIQFRCGNALTEDLGEAAFDLVMLNNVAHHFTPAQNFELAKRVSRALAPGGMYSVGEFLRADAPGAGGAVAATMDLYFALTSASGTWSLEEIRSWQREAGLKPLKPIQFPSLPGWTVAPATRPG